MANENAPRSISIDPLKYLDRLPEFNGDHRDLQTFITLVDRVFPLLRTYDEPSQLLFSDMIKSRLKGKAREIIEINCQAQSWNDIKTVLMNNFGERYSIEELFDKLKSVYFKSNSVEFYNDIKNRLRSLNTKTICLVGTGPAANECARNNMRTALNVFREKLPEPMKTIITCRNPDSLEEAMDILFQSGYAYHTRNGAPNEKNHNQQGKGKEKPNQTNHNASKPGRYNNGNQHYKNNNNQQPRHENGGYRPNNGNQHPSEPIRNHQNAGYRPYNGNQRTPEPMDINMVENHNQHHSQENIYGNGNQTNTVEDHNQENGYQNDEGDNNSFYYNDNQDMSDNTPTNFHIQASRVNYPI